MTNALKLLLLLAITSAVLYFRTVRDTPVPHETSMVVIFTTNSAPASAR
jgi:hypothetical protein